MIEKSETIGALAAALAKAQSQMRAAEKSSTNPHFKSRYADLAEVWEACREPLSSNGLSVSQHPTLTTEAVALETIMMHSSGEWMLSCCWSKPRDLSPQSIGSVITYLRRYSLAAIVGIVQDDDDGESTQPVKRPAVTTTHEYRWSDKERAAFCAKLSEIGGPPYDILAAWCETKGRPRPSGMQREARDKLMSWLQSEQGKAEFGGQKS